DQGIFDSGCSRHMTGNKSFLIEYQEIDGVFVAFGGSHKGGKIAGKGKIRINRLNLFIYLSFIQYVSWYQEPKFQIKMSPRRSKGEESEYPFFEGDGSSYDEWRKYVYDTDIEDVIEEEEGFVGKGNLVEINILMAKNIKEPKFQIKMSPRRSKGEESEYLFYEGDGSSYDEWRKYVYDTDIKDVIEEEEGFVGKDDQGSRSSHYKEKKFDARDTNLDAMCIRDE
nr:hypothetical protein [Tanacetum cinerariifolium]